MLHAFRLYVAIFQCKKKISVLVILVIIALLVDMTLSTFSDILTEQFSSLGVLLLFIAIIIAIFGVGQYFLLVFLNQLSK